MIMSKIGELVWSPELVSPKECGRLTLTQTCKSCSCSLCLKRRHKSLLIRLDPKFQQSVGFPTCGVKRKFVQRAGGPWISVFWWLRFSSHGGHGTHHPMNMSSRGFYCLFPKTMMPWSMLNWWWSFNITCTSSLDLPIGFSIIQLC